MVKNLASPQLNIHGKNSWGSKTSNFICGCIHDCRYCFSKSNCIRRGVKEPDTWKDEVVSQEDLHCEVNKYSGQFMFPSKHDITPLHLDENIYMMRKILEKGNSIFCVTKPHLECIEKICDEFSGYKDTLHFCFTIGSTNSDTLKFWEPGATSYEERLECLKLSFSLGFSTSVSSEPLLDRNLDGLVDGLTPYITGNLWFGKMNFPIQGLKVNGHGDTETMKKVRNLINFHNDPNFIQYYYNKYKDNPKIEWKEHFRKEIFSGTQKTW